MSALLMFSCGARKKDKTHTDKTVKTEVSQKESETSKEALNIKSNAEAQTNIQNGTVTKKTTYEPIDASKPATVIDKLGKRIDLNNSKYTEEETTATTNTQKNEKSNFQDQSKKEVAKQSEAHQKKAAKKETDNLHLDRGSNIGVLIGLGVALFGLVYAVYKYRDKIWWV